MEISPEKKEKLLHSAEMLLWKTELLIETCDNWLSPEEGLKNVEKRMEERDRAERKEKWTKILARLPRLRNLKVENFINHE
jgi:hypothetical protein